MRSASIAIIDDDTSVRRSAESLLRSAGFVATGFTSVENFLKSDQRSHTDCVILDVILPGMCGLEAIPIFKRDLPNTKIIVVSGSGRARGLAILEAATRLGADATFTKPFDPTQFLASVRSMSS